MDKKFVKLILACVFMMLPSCGGDSGPSTAPTLQVELQSSYKTDGSGSDAEWASAVTNFQGRQTGFNSLGNILANNTSVTPSEITLWDSGTTYDVAGNTVKYCDDTFCGIFSNAWWTLGDTPSFVPDSSSPWKLVELMESDCVTDIENNVTDWDANGEYNGGTYVSYDGRCYMAKWWTKGDIPNPDPENPWDTPWEVTACDGTAEEPLLNPVGGGIGEVELPPQPVNDVFPGGTPTVPVVIPSLLEESTGSVATSETELPPTGYEFLRQVTTTHWDWMFPLRSGKYHAEGGIRNLPPIAEADGSTDNYTLANFIKAVLAYNNWASQHNYKQFLNEGTLKQQAQEFLAFWAKAARETSGSWATASTPWIVSYTNGQGETTNVWKGAVYWTEEEGHSTNSDGSSSTIDERYTDKSSAYKPVAGRSYHGRGIIQLSYNYNYGLYSNWLYDNNIRRDIIGTRDVLLTRPDYVANSGDVSILSGIWFWMTPQGAKPSCHDVLYGDVYNVSGKTQEQGLPPRNDGGAVPVAAGDTTDESVLAYRIGTIINIVNGGKECNKAAAWHEGPMQRISYYNAYTMYFNDQISGLNATRITDATNVWTQKVSDGSGDVLKMASCYAQKSYYSW